MKKALFILTVITLMLLSAIMVSADNTPITHTYLKEIKPSGEYVFEITLTPTANIAGKKIKPIIATYDSRNAFCGFTIGGTKLYTSNHVVAGTAKSFEISVAPTKTPKTIKLMLWDQTINNLTPVSQFELVPNTVCNENFGAIANINLTKAQSGDYYFETVFNPSVDGTYNPVIRMYDASGNICGFKEFESVTLKAGQPILKELSLYSTSTPARIAFTLRKGTEVGQYTEIPVSVSTEKYAMIMEADSSKGVKLFATDGAYNYYDFADEFILSYGNKIVTDKAVAYNYLDELRLKTYNRYADKDSNGKYTTTWTPNYHWLLFFDKEEVYGKLKPSAYYDYVLDDSARLDFSDFLTNYEKRMVRVMISPDGKITSMAFSGDNLYKKLTSGKAYQEAFYDHDKQAFNSTIPVKNNAVILYLPTKKSATENDFKAMTLSELKKGNLYHLKEYTTSSGQQIILITYMLSDQEIATFNTTPKTHINMALNGNGTTAPGIKRHMFNISLVTQPVAVNDRANELANTAMEYVAIGLEGALIGADQGYAITKSYIKVKFAAEIEAARQAINELEAMDKQYNASYYNALKNEISNVVEGKALAFLEEYFLN